MAEDIYAKPDLTKKVRFQTGEKEHRNAYECDDIDDVRIYDNYWAEGSTPPKSQDISTEDQQQSDGDVKKSSCRAAAVCLGLLCLLLLIGLITLVSLYTKSNSEREMEMTQLQTSYNNLTKERHQLQTSYNNLTRDRHQLQTSYNNLTRDRHQLQTSYNNLTRDRHQLQTSYNNLTKERDQLQTSYNNLTGERDQLQKRLDDLNERRDYLQKELKELYEQHGWKYFSGSVYYISSDKKSWQESQNDCQQRRADLMIINSREEHTFAKDFQKRLWIGLTDRGTERTWKWVDGTPLTTSYWAPSEPNGSQQKDEDCAEIKSFDSEKSWNDESCDNKKAWICEKTLGL